MSLFAAIKVSVIVPVHNSAKFLGECLDSICSQTLRDIEIICVDDESSDESPEILARYAKQDDRIRLLRLTNTNPGAADARNAGLELAQGEYLSFLDADDRFDCSLLEKTFEQAKKCDADIVMYDARSFDSDTGRFTDVGTYLASNYLPAKEVFCKDDLENRDVFRITNGAAWCMLFRRSFINLTEIKFKPHYHTDDLFFTYSALILADRITRVEEKLLFYRENNSSSQTAKRTVTPLSATDAWIELKQSLIEKKQYDAVRTAFKNKALSYCRWYLENIADADAFSVLFHKLHNSGIKELGFEASEKDYYDPSLYEWCMNVTEKTEAHFLFDRMQQTTEKLYLYNPEYSFPKDKVKANDRVVLYGAGNVGKRYFAENMKNGYCEIVAWADKHAQEIGGILISADRIKEMDYDYVLIAAGSEEVRASIKKDLKELNIGRIL